MFLNTIQERCFASATEQFQQFREMMPYYFRNDLATSQLDCIDGIRTIQKNSEDKKQKISYALFGLAIVAVFALPTIVETLTLLRVSPLMKWLPSDIPFITIEKTGIILWVLIIIVLILNYLGLIRKSRKP